jgi:GH25 family lysozyme M1 (1,4-beta-N-acetylmuramidase)
MTVFGIDCSHYDMSRGPMDFAAMYRDGIRFVTSKATEGDSYQDPHFATCLTNAHAAGIPVLGAYHVVRSGPSIASQVTYLTAYLDHTIPWWRTHPNFMIQVDLERWPQDNVSAATGCAFADAARHATGKYVIVYASKGQYGNSIPAGCDIWNANYPSSRAAHYSALYPGDNGVGWNAYSGRTPVIWQYSSTATIGSQPGCDANAYRGTLDQLLALTSNSSQEIPMDASTIQMPWGQSLPAYMSAVERSVLDVTLTNTTALLAQLAAVRSTLDAQAQTITNLTALLQQSGNPDVAPLVQQIQAMTAQVARLTDAEVAQTAQITALQAKLAAAEKAAADVLNAP